MRLDLLRHGETESGGGFRGSLDDALTAVGWEQMRSGIATRGPWDVLVSSPLQRCAAFADALAAERGLPLHLEADLRELHFGEWEGRSAAELMETDSEALGHFWADPYAFTPPGGESLLSLRERVTQAVHGLAAENMGKTIALFTHGGVLDVLYRAATGLGLQDARTWQIGNTAVNRLLWTPDSGLSLVGWADTTHLEDESLDERFS